MVWRQLLLVEHVDIGGVQKAEPQSKKQPEENVGREGLAIVGPSIVIALTFTIAVTGSILIALSLRFSGVMGVLQSLLKWPWLPERGGLGHKIPRL